ncbi:MAG: folate-binding protein [Opitutaceae bacterium]|nr:folate-binding protein [Opitutaceae bacterium]
MNISEKVAGFSEFRPAAWIRVTGEDALDFLQSQVTQDLRSLEDQGLVYGLWLSQKGRVLADSLFFKVSSHEFFIMSHHCPGAFFLERMESYIVADDVVVKDITPQWKGMTAWGDTAVEWMAGATGVSEQSEKFHRWQGGFLFRGRRGVNPHLEWLAEGFPPLPEGAGPTIPGEVVERARILAGLPSVPEDVGPGELPNEAGLEDSAISYVKGCYLGQETMARLKAMGQVRRKLMRVGGEGDRPPSGPRPLFQGAKKIGELRSTASVPAGGYVGFALVTLLGFELSRGLSLEPGGPETLRLLQA